MQEITISHEMECDEDTYWYKCVFDADYNTALYLNELHFPQYVLEKYTDDGETISRVVRASPKIPPIPAAAKKVIGDGLAYTEAGSFPRSTRHYTFTATPNALADKATTAGDMYVEVLGPRRIARIAKISVDVRIFMVGRLVEDQILNSLRTSYERAVSFTNGWVKEKGY
jgi:hypothetical protein